MGGREKKASRLVHRLMEAANDDSINMELIMAVAGDREPAAGEKGRIEDLKKSLGDKFYSELLFRLSNEYYSHERAERIWKEILRHKRKMSGKMGRNVGISVAALDYLMNVRKQLNDAEFIAEPKMKAILNVAIHDQLTGLYGRAVFESLLHHELHRHSRYGNVVSLIMMDLDDFKLLNDQRGHRHGDKVLARFGRLITDSVREVDIPCRYGGEEFAVILPQTGLGEAEEIARRICQAARDSHRPDLTTTISLGVANCPQNAGNVEELIKAADQALYQAKSQGKDRVAVAEKRKPTRGANLQENIR